LFLISSDKIPIVIIGINKIINHGVNSKNIERLAIPESNILGAGSGKTHVSKLVINKKNPIIKYVEGELKKALSSLIKIAFICYLKVY